MGIFIGLIIRLVREEVQFKHLTETFSLTFRFLIIYPLIFPFILMGSKEEFVEELARRIIQDSPNKKLRKNVANLKERLIKQLAFPRVFGVWWRFLNSVSKNYDEFILININLAKDIISRKENKKILVVTENPNKIIVSQCNSFPCFQERRLKVC